MKLVAFIGSLRAQSYNRMLFNHYRKALGSQAQITEARIDDFPLYNEDLKVGGKQPEAALRVAEQVREADGILFFSPEYNYSVPGVLKNAIDWLSKVPKQPFSGKPAAILSASQGKFGGARMQYQLRQVGIFLDIRFMNTPEVMVGEAQHKFDEQGSLKDAETEKFLGKHWDAFRGLIEESIRVSKQL